MLLAITAVNSTTLKLVQHSDFEDRKLVCNDGSPGGYYIRLAPGAATDEEKNTWVFFQEGGGKFI